MALFVGYDLSNWPGQGLPDLDPTGALVTGNRLIAGLILNRLFCDPGSYLQLPDFGINLLSFLYGRTTGFTSAAISQMISKELRKIELLDTVDVAVLIGADGSITINIAVTPVASGNFAMTISAAAQASAFDVVVVL